ncbi:FAD-binding oxidoreductase [Actinoplanes sp. TBRC 11911]|uniref:FAD-binding oxidoreductase n=1 Tax=Actinoplanes sp. TBRC 11911 TaxID=2729386 RepID=UPI00145D62CA|nr:FAD-binding oxidoreductase [Actinoplanes sp. TBRC 11911]NMO52879.1 FAD-binding oxidoreductase [Actinoplanes sp. TBRC 11911]
MFRSDRMGMPDGLAVIGPGDAGYERVRSTAMRAGSPALVLQPVDVAQVRAALAVARRRGVAVGLRSGGHGISGRSTNDGGVVIDLSRMNRIEVLSERDRLVRVQAGARWKDVAAALAPYGWALSSGDYGGVGVGGLATAGGLGYLAREHGLTIDHVRGASVVLADGSVVRAGADADPDLWWAIRGAGANFGIVTSFDFEVDDVGDVGFGRFVLDATDTAGVIARWGAAMEAAPRDVTTNLIIVPGPDGRLAATIMGVVNSAEPDVVAERFAPLLRAGPLLQQTVRHLPYAQVMDNTGDRPEKVATGEPISRSGLIEHLTPEFSTVAHQFARSGATYFFQFRAAGGAVADVDPGATAYPHRSANFQVGAFGNSHRELGAAWEPMEAHFRGLYLSFDSDLRPERIAQAWPPKTLARLRELKLRYDPGNVFRDNFDLIPPA